VSVLAVLSTSAEIPVLNAIECADDEKDYIDNEFAA
jgi:hypothetical protein